MSISNGYVQILAESAIDNEIFEDFEEFISGIGEGEVYDESSTFWEGSLDARHLAQIIARDVDFYTTWKECPETGDEIQQTKAEALVNFEFHLVDGACKEYITTGECRSDAYGTPYDDFTDFLLHSGAHTPEKCGSITPKALIEEAVKQELTAAAALKHLQSVPLEEAMELALEYYGENVAINCAGDGTPCTEEIRALAAEWVRVNKSLLSAGTAAYEDGEFFIGVEECALCGGWSNEHPYYMPKGYLNLDFTVEMPGEFSPREALQDALTGYMEKIIGLNLPYSSGTRRICPYVINA